MEKTKITRKPLKKAAKAALKKHYLLFVILCIFAGISGAGSSGITDLLNIGSRTAGSEEGVVTSIPVLNPSGMIEAIITDSVPGYESQAQIAENEGASQGIKVLGLFTLQSSRGILASVVNKISSGSIYVTIYSAIVNITHSSSFANVFFIVVAVLIVLAFHAFVSSVYRSAYLRLFLEGRMYKNVPVSRLLFFFRVKKFLKATLTMFLVFIFQMLWNITIIGGIIKRYSYSQVPFIVAENPDIGPLEAIRLSRRMMNGHKWERFVLELSFIPWDLLDIITLGLLGTFFLEPYKVSVTAEYYAALRDIYKNGGGEGCACLNDLYLFEKASDELINTSYADLIDLANTPATEPFISMNPVKRFFAKWFGVVLSYNNEEDLAYRSFQIRKHKLERFEKVQKGEMYPSRLYPIPEKERRENMEDLGPMRCYSITSLILLFFSLCLVGWLWEVSLHLVTDGTFINRGTMHGPWLPIYGAGSLMILILLRRLRNIPWLEFIAAVVLCGIVEYFTHWYLELTKGTKWWDYSGYLLNLNGRICAEGLLVFGLGGMAIVYLLAPFLDNFFRKIKSKIAIIICVVLLAAFAADAVYSSKHPNMGKGITDYGDGSFLRSWQTPFSAEADNI